MHGEVIKIDDTSADSFSYFMLNDMATLQNVIIIMYVTIHSICILYID